MTAALGVEGLGDAAGNRGRAALRPPGLVNYVTAELPLQAPRSDRFDASGITPRAGNRPNFRDGPWPPLGPSGTIESDGWHARDGRGVAARRTTPVLVVPPRPGLDSLKLDKLNDLMGDLRDPRWLYAKGAMFVALGGLASGLLLLDHPDLKTASLLVLAIWAFARAYYFAFYVVEHYVDPRFRFAGLISFARYLWGTRRRVEPPPADGPRSAD